MVSPRPLVERQHRRLAQLGLRGAPCISGEAQYSDAPPVPETLFKRSVDTRGAKHGKY